MARMGAELPQFISEPIEPVAGTFDAGAMSRGEPGLPSRFFWRKTKYTLAGVARSWKTSSRDRGELYLRRHWHEIKTESGQRFTLYCERQAKNRNKPKQRWWIYSVSATK